jgi:hypothetical protein
MLKMRTQHPRLPADSVCIHFQHSVVAPCPLVLKKHLNRVPLARCMPAAPGVTATVDGADWQEARDAVPPRLAAAAAAAAAVRRLPLPGAAVRRLPPGPRLRRKHSWYATVGRSDHSQ